jgi:hypothetical protein
MSGSGAAGTKVGIVKMFPQPGQRPRLPAVSSLAESRFPQSHCTEMGIARTPNGGILLVIAWVVQEKNDEQMRINLKAHADF